MSNLLPLVFLPFVLVKYWRLFISILSSQTHTPTLAHPHKHTYTYTHTHPHKHLHIWFLWSFFAWAAFRIVFPAVIFHFSHCWLPELSNLIMYCTYATYIFILYIYIVPNYSLRCSCLMRFLVIRLLFILQFTRQPFRVAEWKTAKYNWQFKKKFKCKFFYN